MSPAVLLYPQIDADLRDVEREAGSGLNIQYGPTVEGRRLFPRERISELWPDNPPDDHLHVFVRSPNRVPTADAHGECFKASRFALPQRRIPD